LAEKGSLAATVDIHRGRPDEGIMEEANRLQAGLMVTGWAKKSPRGSGGGFLTKPSFQALNLGNLPAAQQAQAQQAAAHQEN
jgi:hypothetical protein